MFVCGSGKADIYKPLKPFNKKKKGADGRFSRGHIARLRTFGGFLYACGGGRSLGKWTGKGQWQSFSQLIPSGGDNIGFDDFDGWGESDIYAAGGHGDVWHFDGENWRQLPFPEDVVIGTVCCGGDGKVYISGNNEKTYAGRGDKWEKLEVVDSHPAFDDMVWYEDRVWCTNDDGLWTIKDGKVRFADVPRDVFNCSGHLSTGDGVLLLAGENGAVFKENGEWQTILLFKEMEELLAKG